MAEAGTTLADAGVFAGRRADPVLGVVRVLGSLHGWTFILRTRLPWKDSCLCNPSPGFDVYDHRAQSLGPLQTQEKHSAYLDLTLLSSPPLSCTLAFLMKRTHFRFRNLGHFPSWAMPVSA